MILVIVAVMAKPYAAIPAALLVLGFVGWVSAGLVDASPPGRLVRVAFLAAMLGVLAYQLARYLTPGRSQLAGAACAGAR